jgi:N-acetyl-beta-hexosaminidase
MCRIKKPRIKRFSCGALAFGTLALLWSISMIGWAATPEVRELNLMPYPQQVERAAGDWVLNVESTLRLSSPDEVFIQAALERFRTRFQRQTGTELTLSANGASHQHLIIELTGDRETPKSPGTENPETNNPKTNNAETNNPDTTNSESQNPETTQASSIPLEVLTPEREAYRLTIGTDRIHLQARTYQGVNHGLETLLQLLTTAADTDGGRKITLPQLTIEDSPRFRWRGLMLDSVRNFLSVDTIKRQLDGMAAAKLNIFHWHLTDDQGWRLESRHYPKLHKQASDGLYYTRDEIRDIVAYAMERGIQVVPEIDMPGHTSAIGVAYPELMSAPGPYAMEDRWGVHTPLLNPANEDVYVFADKIFAEVAELFPFTYVHIGGDEVNPRDWLANAGIRAFMKRQNLATPEELHAYFNQRLAHILAKHHRRMIGWDEIFHPGLPDGTIVQSWRGPDSLGEIANQGYPTLLSTGFYLDQPQPTAYHYRNTIFPVPSGALGDLDI